MGRPFLERVAVANYKSIGRCHVSVARIAVLVGPNGSGKSNFLDALRFVSDALITTPEHALRDRGGVSEVRRRSWGHPRNFSITLRLRFPGSGRAVYGFVIGSRGDERKFYVQSERCTVADSQGRIRAHYRARAGTLLEGVPSSTVPRHIEPDRLFLTVLSALPEFRPAYDVLAHMGFYSLNPQRLRELQDPDPGERLRRDGSNIASVLRQLQGTSPETLRRITAYLSAIVPGIHAVSPVAVGNKETLEFRQVMRGSRHPWRFWAANMSDGTLRALGVLVAAFHASRAGSAISLVGIEEPELAIHPWAALKLMDALLEASRHVQVIITTHSPDLIEHEELDPGSFLAVESLDGETMIAHIDPASRAALEERLYTAGELLRLGQLRPRGPLSKATGT